MSSPGDSLPPDLRDIDALLAARRTDTSATELDRIRVRTQERLTARAARPSRGHLTRSWVPAVAAVAVLVTAGGAAALTALDSSGGSTHASAAVVQYHGNECPPGQHFSPSQNSCVPDGPPCPQGEHPGPNQSSCVPDGQPRAVRPSTPFPIGTPANQTAVSKRPRAQACVSRRGLTLHPRSPRGTRLLAVGLLVNGHAVASRAARNAGGEVTHISFSLAGRLRGTYRVDVRMRVAGKNGRIRIINVRHAYRTCTATHSRAARRG
jgi:hypothetical protein